MEMVKSNQKITSDQYLMSSLGIAYVQLFFAVNAL